MEKSKIKLFIENMLFYGGLTMLTKALPFITLPIITRLLPDASNYGIVDMFNIINSFGIAFAIMGLYDAMFREFFEDKKNEEYQKLVTSTTGRLVFFSSIIIVFITIIFREKISFLLFKDIAYSKLVFYSGISIFLGAMSSIVGAPTRMRNQRRTYLVTGVGFPLIGFLFTYIFIKKGYMYEGIIFGTLIMNFISFIVFAILNRKDFNFKLFDKNVAKELCKIGIPLLPTFLIYWVFNSMDRIMINRMLGASELGVYSVGSKVASISQLVYAAFAGGWQYFAFSVMKDDDQVKVNSLVFEYLGILSFTVFILAFPFINPVFNYFFEGDYRRGSEVFSYLLLSPLMLMLFQIIGNQLLVIKKSYLITISLFIGLILNLILNYYLIPNFGIKGAAFATLLSYTVSVIVMALICLKNNLLIINKKYLIIFILIFICIFINFNFLNKYLLLYGIMFLGIILGYLGDLKKLIKGECR